MDYELLVLDIDGTVTDSNKEVLPRTRDEIIRIQKQGVKVVLASGRPPEGILPVAGSLQLDQYDSYLLAFNGGKIIRLQTGECIFEKRLPSHIPKRLQKDALDYGIGMAAYGNGALLAGTASDQYLELESRVSRLPIQYVEKLGAQPELAVNQCILTGDPDTLERVEPILVGRYLHEAQIFHSEPFYLEVSPKNVTRHMG